MRLSKEDRESLSYAKNLLENPGLAARLTNMIGKPIEAGIKWLPANWADTINKATMVSLEKALDIALLTLKDRPIMEAWDRLHKLAVTATGAGGGAFGLAGLPFELPVSTTIMLRSIADIARSEGERLNLIESKLACVEVFAFGGRSASDDTDDSAYFIIRGMLARSVSEARGRQLYCRKRSRYQGSAGTGKVRRQNCNPFWHDRFSESSGSSDPRYRRGRGSDHKLDFYRSLPKYGARPFYRS